MVWAPKDRLEICNAAVVVAGGFVVGTRAATPQNFVGLAHVPPSIKATEPLNFIELVNAEGTIWAVMVTAWPSFGVADETALMVVVVVAELMV
jgi:hypothetical protein